MQVQVAGQTFILREGSDTGYDGYYVEARGIENEGVSYQGSPTVIKLIPPIGPIDKLDAGAIYQQAKAQIEAASPDAGQFLP